MERRDFLHASVIALGAATMEKILSAQAGAPSAATNVVLTDGLDPLDAIDPVAPTGLKPTATVDARFPVSYQRSVPAATRVMTAHFHAISQRDYTALAKTMHFPFGLVERVDGVLINSPAELNHKQAPPSFNFYPDGGLAREQSRLNVGAYDILTNMEVICFDATHVSMAMTYDRFNKQGFRTLRNEGVYCVTNNDGRWAIQMASTIWKPADFIGKVFPDAEAAAIRLRANHTDSYINDLDIIDHPRPTRGRHFGIAGGGVGNLVGSAAGADRMTQFKVKGVKSRLTGAGPAGAARGGGDPDDPGGAGAGAGAPGRAGGPAGRAGGRGGRGSLDPLSPDPRQRSNYDNRTEPKWAGQPRSWERLGINDWWESRIAPDYRIIHSFSDKVHRYAGAARYNAAGELLNISMEVAVVVMGSGGDWAGNGSMRYTTTHDRLNDEMN